MFVGPILGPILGGVLGEAKGRRSTFILLIIVAAIFFVLVLVFLPETHHHFVLRKMGAKEPQKVELVEEKAYIEANPPVFQTPWKALIFAFKPHSSPYLAVCSLEFGAFYGCLTLFSPIMAAPPYSYSQSIIGLLYIPMGVGAMIASIFGGRISDWSASKYSGVVEGRMYINLIVSSIFFVPGLLIYGWCLQMQTNIAAILISMFIMGFACMAYFPALMSYISGHNQAEAAAACAAMFCVVLVSAGVSSEVVIYIAEAIGLGWLSVLFVGAWVIPTVLSLYLVKSKINVAAKNKVAVSMDA